MEGKEVLIVHSVLVYTAYIASRLMSGDNSLPHKPFACSLRAPALLGAGPGVHVACCPQSALFLGSALPQSLTRDPSPV